METISRWRAAALAFFLTIGASGAVAVAPFVGGFLSAFLASIGLFILIPLIVLTPELVPYVDDGSEPAPPRREPSGDPVADLRDRYANGELSRQEFERRLDDLLATEGLSLDDIRTEGGTRRTGDTGGTGDGTRERRRERERT
ncbi:SHOCT domain-containing protein [Halobaculum sp. MBLA0143]|uniref:SHOCT domain-containing protein n=1 Tax=Halobaculum sp. MBLA0143 TaxID=3079933 RepID=UPI00352562E5